MRDAAAGLADDLHALETAPTYGLNARALILRAAAAAAAGGDDDDDDLLPAIGADPARLAAAARAEAVKAGRALGSAWPQAEKPYPDLIRHAKVDRAARVPVLARLAGEHLALALHARLGVGRAALVADPARAVTALATPAGPGRRHRGRPHPGTGPVPGRHHHRDVHRPGGPGERAGRGRGGSGGGCSRCRRACGAPPASPEAVGPGRRPADG